jgi:hypothetical protein
MGTQQIFLIVVSVIMVCGAIGLGLSMYNNASYKSNESALTTEMRGYTAQLIGFWNTTTDLGGAGYLNANITVSKVCAFLAWSGANNSYKSANGEFRLTSVTTVGSTVVVTLKALGTDKKNNKFPFITSTITFNQSVTTAPPITTTRGSATSF